jgi:hypothetical protein
MTFNIRGRHQGVEAAVELLRLLSRGIRRFVEIRKGRWKKEEEKSRLVL